MIFDQVSLYFLFSSRVITLSKRNAVPLLASTERLYHWLSAISSQMMKHRVLIALRRVVLATTIDLTATPAITSAGTTTTTTTTHLQEKSLLNFNSQELID